MNDLDRAFLRIALDKGFVTKADVVEVEEALARDPRARAVEVLVALGMLDIAARDDLERLVAGAAEGAGPAAAPSAKAGGPAPGKTGPSGGTPGAAAPGGASAAKATGGRAGPSKRRTQEFFGPSAGLDADATPPPGPRPASAAPASAERTMDFDARLAQRAGAAGPGRAKRAEPPAGDLPASGQTIDFDARLAQRGGGGGAGRAKRAEPPPAGDPPVRGQAADRVPDAPASGQTIDFDAKLAALEAKRHRGPAPKERSGAEGAPAQPPAGDRAPAAPASGHTIDFDAKLAALEAKHRRPAPPAGTDRTIDFDAKLAALEAKHRRGAGASGATAAPSAAERPSGDDPAEPPSAPRAQVVIDAGASSGSGSGDGEESHESTIRVGATSRAPAERPRDPSPAAGSGRGSGKPPRDRLALLEEDDGGPVASDGVTMDVDADAFLAGPGSGGYVPPRAAAGAGSREPKRFGPLPSSSGGHARPGQDKDKPKEKAAESSGATDEAAAADPMVGQTIGGCRIERFLGRGGMGSVYLAKQLDLDRQVAFKVLSEELTQDPQQIEQFFREARALARLEHPNIVTIYNVGREDKVHFLLMQLVTGGNLEDWLRERGRPTSTACCELVVQIARGLAEAHKKGIVHRDIKPANVLLADGPVLKITDFGLARMDEEAVGFGEGRIVGTPYFMAPEQIDGRKVDGRTDIYALGATFYYMLTGKHPFEAESAVEVLLMHVNDALTPPHEVLASVPEPLSRMVAKMMAKEPGDRYDSLDLLLRDLEAFQRGQKVEVEVVADRPGGPTASLDLFGTEDGKPPDIEKLLAPLRGERARGVYLGLVAVAVTVVLLAAVALGPLRSSLSSAAAAPLDLEGETASDGTDRVPLEEAERLFSQGLHLAARDRFEAAAREIPELAPEAERRIRELLADAEQHARLRVDRSQKHLDAGDPGAAIEHLLGFPDGMRGLAPSVDKLIADQLSEVRALLAQRNLAYVEGGPFQAGEGAADGALPPRQATTRGFYIDITEVTNRRYALHVRMRGGASPEAWHQGTHPPGEEELPVTGVTVADAQSFARAAGGRLATPLEWERAAGWDPVARKKRAFPWGDDLRADGCNFAGYAAGRGKALPVRTVLADKSAYGVYDLAGNVGEWVLGPHPSGPLAAEGEVALVMGGAFATVELRLARATFFAGPFAPDLRGPAIGFRVVYDKLPQ